MANNLVSRSGWFTPTERVFRIQWTRGSPGSQARSVRAEEERPPHKKTAGGGISPDCNLWFVCSVQYSLICDKSVTTQNLVFLSY
jgi:hypothetical protein